MQHDIYDLIDMDEFEYVEDEELEYIISPQECTPVSERGLMMKRELCKGNNVRNADKSDHHNRCDTVAPRITSTLKDVITSFELNKTSDCKRGKLHMIEEAFARLISNESLSRKQIARALKTQSICLTTGEIYASRNRLREALRSNPSLRIDRESLKTCPLVKHLLVPLYFIH